MCTDFQFRTMLSKCCIFFVLVSSRFLLSSSLEMGGIISGNRQGSAPLGVTLGDGDLDVEGVCSRAGTACVNCTHAVTCIALPVGWLRVPLQACDAEGSTCNARLGGCSAQPAPECRPEAQQFRHVCEQVGIFPDALDCRKFHMCSPPVDYPHGRPAQHHAALCPRHYAYHALTAQCRIKLEYGQCDWQPAPDCLSIGQTGALVDSPNHYYVCLRRQGLLYPQVFVCPYGYFFYDNFCHGTPRTNDDGRRWTPTDKEVVRATTESSTETRTEPEMQTTTVGRVTEYPPDTFLADKFDMSNYDTAIREEDSQTLHDSFEYSGISSESF